MKLASLPGKTRCGKPTPTLSASDWKSLFIGHKLCLVSGTTTAPGSTWALGGVQGTNGLDNFVHATPFLPSARGADGNRWPRRGSQARRAAAESRRARRREAASHALRGLRSPPAGPGKRGRTEFTDVVGLEAARRGESSGKPSNSPLKGGFPRMGNLAPPRLKWSPDVASE